MHPKEIFIKDYIYLLPEGKIAKYPLSERDASKLLVYKEGNISEDVFYNIADHIPSESLLIFNDTKVIEARILFQKASGGIIEIFCLEPHEGYYNIITAMLQQAKVKWQCLVGGASKWKHGSLLNKKIQSEGKEIELTAALVEQRSDCFLIEFSWTPAELNFAEILHYCGIVPLPPYIKRAVEKKDEERYQTIYAYFDGSVAAPTAGLHFTEKIFNKLKKKNIEKEFVTLHVGAGTFRPVKSETIEAHDMHSELITVSKKAIQNILHNLDNNIITVGTTSFRTIESLFWLGVKLKLANSLFGEKKSIKNMFLTQWEAYELGDKNISVKEALNELVGEMEEQHSEYLTARTQILIAPGYKPRIVNALITNFHQPQSTLLLLVAAIIGNNWKKVYEYALQRDFRFLSYGDGSLLWR